MTRPARLTLGLVALALGLVLGVALSGVDATDPLPPDDRAVLLNPARYLCTALNEAGHTDRDASDLCLLQAEAQAAGDPAPWLSTAEVRHLCRTLDEAGSDSTNDVVLETCREVLR